MMEDDELREVLEARAGDARIPLAERARAVAAAHPREAGARWRVRAWGRSVTLVATAVGVTVVVVAALGLPSPTPDLEVGPSGSPDTTLAGSAPPSPVPTVAPQEPVEPWRTLTWSMGDDVKFDEKGRNTYVGSAVFWHEHWIAVGSDIDLTTHHVTGHVWASTDGRTWSRDDAWLDIKLDRIVATVDRLVVVGVHRAPDVGDAPGATRATMWTSTDGDAWTEAPLPDQPSDYWVVRSAAVGGHGWLVHTVDIDGNERWLAGDPVDGWQEIVDPAAFAGAQIYDVVGTPDGWLAFGMTGFHPDGGNGFGPMGDPSDDRGAIWESADGEHWTAANVQRPGTSIDSIVTVAGGWIATGTDHGGCPGCIGHPRLLWRSDDGRSWWPVDIDLANLNRFGGTVIAGDGRRGLLLDTDDDSRLRVRETSDGIGWSDVAVVLDPSMGPPAIQSVAAVTVGPHGILTFIDPSTRSEDHAWMVPRVGVSGTPPSDGATQPPAATPHDPICEPAGQPCGP
jgi:hypothetical protein